MLKTNKGDPDEIKKQWEKVTEELNQFGSGPKKNINEWQTTFLNWKNQVRHKARVIKTYIKQTGGGTECDKQLSYLEERALVCWGRVAVDGASIGDLGIITGKSDDNVLARSLSPASPLSTASSVDCLCTSDTLYTNNVPRSY